MLPKNHLDLHSLGLNIMPTKDKKALVTWKPLQSNFADQSQILEWERLQPSGWAVITGAISKVFVLDFDGPTGEELLTKYGLKPHVKTPHGYHCYYTHPGSSISNGTALLPGLDVRGDGGYVVALNGGSYQWLRDFTPDDPFTLPREMQIAIGLAAPVAEVPVLIADKSPATSTPFSYEVFLNDALERSRQMGRNEAGFWLATQLRDNGFSEAQAFDMGAEYVDRVDQIDAKGHESEYKWSEYVASVKSAYAKPAREPWTGNALPTLPTPPRIDLANKSNLSFLSMTELKEQIRIEGATPILVDGLLTGEGVHLAGGDSGLGKSPFFYQLGLCIATGTPFLGRDTAKAKVLYFDMESPLEGSFNLLHTLTSFLELTKNPDVNQNFKVTDHGEQGHILAAVREHRPGLVIIDTLKAFLPIAAGNENDAPANFIKALKEIARDYKCAFLIIHHTRKDTTTAKGEQTHLDDPNMRVMEWMKMVAGSRTLINGTDNRIAMDIPKPNGQFKDAVLVIRGHGKLRGETDLIYIERVKDDQDEPLGYRQCTGSVNLLELQYREFYIALPQLFTPKDCKFLCGMSDTTATRFIKRCKTLNIVQSLKHNQYSKLR